MLDIMQKTIKTYNMLPCQKTGGAVTVIITAVSGGADSMALLHALMELKEELSIDLVAAHVNHNLRGGESDLDADLVKNTCLMHNIPIEMLEADVKSLARKKKISLEEAGREARYGFFDSRLKKYNADKIAIAHTKNDNAETILLNLFRGTGLDGLCGIPPVRDQYIRPLIDISRNEVENYLNARGIVYRQDSSNSDNEFARNKVRNIVMPVITDNFGYSAIEAIIRCSSLLRGDSGLLESTAKQLFDDCLVETGDNHIVALDAKKMEALPLAAKRRLARIGIKKLCDNMQDISAHHIDTVLSLTNSKTGKIAELPKGVRGRANYGNIELYIEKNENIPLPFSIELALDKAIIMPSTGKTITASLKKPIFNDENTYDCCTNEFQYDRIKGSLMVRTRQPGDVIYLSGVGKKKLQDYFTDIKMPRRKRDNIPLVADGQDILWILDDRGRVNDLYKPIAGTRSIFIIIQ